VNERQARKRTKHSGMVRLHNRRVAAYMLRDGSIEFRFRSITPQREIQDREIRLSQEALAAMVVLAETLRKRAATG